MRIAWFVLLFIGAASFGQETDFSHLNFEQNIIHPVTGNWEFYSEKLITQSEIDSGLYKPEAVQLPHSWSSGVGGEPYGVATYHTRLKLPSRIGGQLAIYIPFVRCAAKVYVDGRVVDSLGTVGLKPYYHSKLAGLLVSLPDREKVDLVIQIANYDFRWGGLGSNIKIGKISTILNVNQIKNGFDLFFIGSLLTMSLYLVTMYFLYREGYSFLFLSMICLAVALRTSTTESGSLFLPILFPDFGWGLWKKIEFFSVYCIVALFPLYVSCVFPKESNKKIDLFFAVVAVALCSLVIFTSHSVYVLLLDVSHIGLLLGFVYACVVAIKAWRNKNSDAKTLFFGLLVAFPFIFLEILKNSVLQIPIPFTHLVEFGVLSFLLFQVYVLANHYAMTYKNLEHVVRDKTAELTESNEIKNRILAILSHDVRGPVNNLKAIMNMFNKGHLTEVELKPMTRKIEVQAGNVSLLIENILLLVKSQLNGVSITMETFDLADWVSGHFSLYNLQASEKEIGIKSSMPEGLRVKADKNVVSLVIRNLIANAIKYSNRNSSIEISTREMGSLVMLSVTDSGQGMTYLQVQALFSKKNSISSVTGTEKETGIGLGLKLCRDYLLMMGSDFEIRSSPGHGTSVSITLQRG